MITAQLKASVVLVAILLTVSIAAKAIGSLQPPNPALKGFVEGCEDKPQPCWYGIVPGKTMIGEAERLVGKYGYSSRREIEGEVVYDTNTVSDLSMPVTLVYTLDGVIWSVILTPKFTNLGDVMAVLDNPTNIAFSPSAKIHFLFENGLVGIENYSPGATSISVHSQLNYMIYVMGETMPTRTWHGFLRKWRYCQLEPASPSCAA